MCGVVYRTPTKQHCALEWTKTLRRINAHESKRCRLRVKKDSKVLGATAGGEAKEKGTGAEEKKKKTSGTSADAVSLSVPHTASGAEAVKVS